MKILWLTNYPLPAMAEKLRLPITVNEGWLLGLSNLLVNNQCDMVFCCALEGVSKDIQYRESNVSFYGISDKNSHKYNANLKDKFKEILIKEKPDIIHIMGSEFPHSYSIFEACKALKIEEKCVLSMQGLIERIAQSYDLGIEEKNKKKRLLWDLLVKDSILLNKKDFENRGNYERKLLKEIKSVIGRTEWDYLCVKQVNPKVQYFKCNEILRGVFYQNRWTYDKCEKHSIIISQATYPVKGFHILLKAAGLLLKKYEDLKIFVPSQTIYPKAMQRCRFLNSDYANYIVQLIKGYRLEGHIEFLGSLDAESMCKAYLKSNVFVCASTIENSSNSLGEAMLLGMPIVSSYVGGLGSMMTHGKEGFFFPLQEEYMLAAYIEILFEDINLAVKLGEQSHKRAVKTHDADKNTKDIMECYNHLCQEAKKKQEG